MTEETIFEAALEKRTPGERAAYLDEVCARDAGLRQRVEGLLLAHDQAGDFLEKPAVEQVAADLSSPGTGNRNSNGNGNEAETIPSAVAAEAIGRCIQPQTQAEEPIVNDGSPGGLLGGFPLDFLVPSSKPGSLGRLDHYEVLEVVGHGGMGVVLKAFDEQLHRVVAIKVLAPQLATSATARKRFIREAQAAAVTHDHVVTIHGVSGGSPLPYLVMQFIAGASLQDRLDRTGPLEPREILRIGMQVAAGLAAAHAQGR
jgi:hypothetical protein